MIKKILLPALVFLFFFALSTAYVSAQTGVGGSTGGTGASGNTGSGSTNVVVKIDNPFAGGEKSLFELLKKIVNDLILPVGGILAVLSFIYSGFLYVTAAGNDAKIKTAHKALLYTSIGTAVLLGAWMLANVVCGTIQQLGGPGCEF